MRALCRFRHDCDGLPEVGDGLFVGAERGGAFGRKDVAQRTRLGRVCYEFIGSATLVRRVGSTGGTGSERAKHVLGDPLHDAVGTTRPGRAPVVEPAVPLGP